MQMNNACHVHKFSLALKLTYKYFYVFNIHMKFLDTKLMVKRFNVSYDGEKEVIMNLTLITITTIHCFMFNVTLQTSRCYIYLKWYNFIQTMFKRDSTT